MNWLLQKIEMEGDIYGMRLNKGKCEYLRFGSAGNVNFRDGVKVPPVQHVKYLGCQLNERGDPGTEIIGRIKHCMTLLTKLHLFFKYGDCDPAKKILVWNAVIRSKLMYGLESTVMNKSVLNRLDSFQMKTLRKILHRPTTYIDRTFSHAKLISEANTAISGEQTGKVILLSELHKQQRIKLLAKLIVLGDDEPSAVVTFTHSLQQHEYGKRRVGRPRLNWLQVTREDLWCDIKSKAAQWRWAGKLDLTRDDHHAAIRDYAVHLNQKHAWTHR